MKYKLTKAEQETVINFDNELDTAHHSQSASWYVHRIHNPKGSGLWLHSC